MKRKPIPTSVEFQELRMTGDTIHGFTPEVYARTRRGPSDCGVIAISLATGVSYQEALDELSKRGLNVMKNGVQASEIRKALRVFGHRAIQISQSSIIRRYPASKHDKTEVTPRQVKRFPAAWRGLPPVLLWTDGHVTLVKDGIAHDWAAGSSMRAWRLDVVVPLEVSDPVEYVKRLGLEPLSTKGV